MALTDNIVAYWKLNESSGNAADSAGSNTGININTVTFAPGLIGNGAVFTTASTNYFEISSGDTDFQFDYNDAFSLQVWINTNTSQNSKFFGRQDSLVAGGGYIIQKTGNSATSSASIQLASVDGSQLLQVDGSTNINDGTWHQIVLTYSGIGSIGGLRLYIDGAEERLSTIGTVLTNTIVGADDEFTIGARENGNQTLNGMLDECGVWSRALSAGEVFQLHNGGAGLTYPFTITDTGGFFLLMD